MIGDLDSHDSILPQYSRAFLLQQHWFFFMNCSIFTSLFDFDIGSLFRRGTTISENRSHEESSHTSAILSIPPSIGAINHPTTCDTAELTQDKPCRPTTPRKAKTVSHTPSNVMKHSTDRAARVSWSGLRFYRPASVKIDVPRESERQEHKGTGFNRKRSGWRTLKWGREQRQMG